LLALTAVRASVSHGDVAQLVLQGDIASAMRMASDRFERAACVADPAARAVLGQLLSRCMLACGQEEEAEDLFQRLLKVYESISRPMVRWHAALDRGMLLLRLNRPGRALECFNAVADDHRAPADVRIEAMAGAAVALHRCSESRSAMQALDVARRLSDGVVDRRVAHLVEAMALEIAALQAVRTCDALDDHALGMVYRESAGDAALYDILCQQLGAAAAALATPLPFAAQRLQHLQHLLSREGNAISAAAQVSQALAWLRERRLMAFEAETRIEAARMLIGRDAVYAAGEVIAPLAANEQQALRGRHGLELAYCLARLYQHQGRPQDALRLYRQHTQLAVLALRHEGEQKKPPRFLEPPQAAAQGSGPAATAASPAGDAARMRLPLRYRRAYQFIMEHLNDQNLSVRQVAAHVDVTERALQRAFSSHLGMTPLELIRTRRMEGIRDDLNQETGGRGVREVAARWGIGNRSTLSHGYRLHFDETPSQTLRGGARTLDDEAALRMAAGLLRPQAPGLGNLSA
jgi:AraC-like DNA-binding protein